MKDIRFREMIFADIPAVLEIEKECFLSFWSFDGYKNELLRDDAKIFIAENKGEIVGFAATRLITSAKEGEILNIAVRRRFQKQGTGTLLLQEIIDFFKANEIESVWLEVRKSNFTAREFYRRNGFIFCGERKNFYTRPTEDALVLKLNL